MSFIDNILNGLTYLDPSQLSITIIGILKFFIEFFAKFWSLLTSNLIDFEFTILEQTINIEISLLFLLTIGGFVLFIWLKLVALIPILPD